MGIYKAKVEGKAMIEKKNITTKAVVLKQPQL